MVLKFKKKIIFATFFSLLSMYLKKILNKENKKRGGEKLHNFLIIYINLCVIKKILNYVLSDISKLIIHEETK